MSCPLKRRLDSRSISKSEASFLRAHLLSPMLVYLILWLHRWIDSFQSTSNIEWVTYMDSLSADEVTLRELPLS